MEEAREHDIRIDNREPVLHRSTYYNIHIHFKRK